MTTVATFTDTYLPTVNGVTYTVRRWLECWNRDFGRMDVVFPAAAGYDPIGREHPVRSLPFPFYEGYRLGFPTGLPSLPTLDIVHAHTPFSIGLRALGLARNTNTPFVASYHTPASEYARYLLPGPLSAFGSLLRRAATAYERRFYDRATLVLTPSQSARQHLRETVGVSSPIRVISNGVDTDRFRPVDGSAFRDRYDLTGPLIGYTGRHGHEKALPELLAAVDWLASDGERERRDRGLDGLTLVLSGDGPARPALEAQAARTDANVRFLGFLERHELPAFYAALDVFSFPSPVETQGLVALEAAACGTPTVAANAGALSETVIDGVTGYHYPPGEPRAFARAIERALADRERLAQNCLERREHHRTERTLETVRKIYSRLSAETGL